MIKVYLDPGHGGHDPGAVGNGIREKDITLSIGTRIRDVLAHDYNGVAVKMSRTGDTYPTLSQRTNAANDWGADFFLSIHINSSAGTAGTGFESFRYTGTGAPTSTYQTAIHDEIMKVIGMRDRGKKQAKFHVLRASSMPALLTENGFINNPSDASKMKDPAWIDAVARAHAVGLAKAFNLKENVHAAAVPARKSSSAVSSIEKAKKKGVMVGFTDGTFREHEPVTRGQLAAVLDRLGLLD